MDWVTNEADTLFTLGEFSNTNVLNAWNPDQQWSRLVSGWETTEPNTATSATLRLAFTKASNGANVTAGTLSAGIKVGGKVHVRAGVRLPNVPKFDTDTGAVAVMWSEPVVEEEETDDTDADTGAGDVSTGDKETKETKTDGATSVTAFGAAIIAAISALAF